jgi:DegV family protein with EDD domain
MKIVTDSAAELTPEEMEKYDIVTAPLFIQFPEGEMKSSDISADDFYNRLEEMRPNIPTTAQPSSGNFAEIYKRILETGKSAFSIHISAGLSGTINAARVGAESISENHNIHFWDTMTLSGGERFQVLAAAMALNAGWSMEKISERLTEIRSKTEVIYTLETLEYLARGGRIGRVSALLGSLLKLKPVINVSHEDGKYSTVTKMRTIPAAMEAIADNLTGIYQNTPVWVTVLHGRFQKGAEELATLLDSRLKVAKMEVTRISPVLGVHTGPGIVGCAVVPMNLMEDLL